MRDLEVAAHLMAQLIPYIISKQLSAHEAAVIACDLARQLIKENMKFEPLLKTM